MGINLEFSGDPALPTLKEKTKALREHKTFFEQKAEVEALVEEANKQETYGEKAIRLTYSYIKERLEKTDTHVTFGLDEVYIVWFSKTLQNWKALVSTTLPDGMYYEVTYNGDKNETYLDAYKKFENVRIPD